MERFLPVAGYEDRYEVSDLGAIRSLNFRRTGRAQLLKQTRDSWGYLSVRLCDGDGVRTRKSFNTHKLVAETFLGPRPDGMAINHKDGNKESNCAANLEYVTATENARHAVKNRLWPWASLSEEKATQIRALSESGMKGTEIAKQFAVSPTTIGRVLNGKLWQLSQKAG